MSQREAGLLDTNVVILLPRIPEAIQPRQSVVSVVTLAELAAGPATAVNAVERTLRQGHVELAMRLFEPLPFNVNTARVYGHVVASLRRAGRKSASRSLDAMIAATALAHGLPLYTCDPVDFEGIEGLQVVAVPHPDRY